MSNPQTSRVTSFSVDSMFDGDSCSVSSNETSTCSGNKSDSDTIESDRFSTNSSNESSAENLILSATQYDNHTPAAHIDELTAIQPLPAIPYSLGELGPPEAVASVEREISPLQQNTQSTHIPIGVHLTPPIASDQAATNRNRRHCRLVIRPILLAASTVILLVEIAAIFAIFLFGIRSPEEVQ